MGPGQTQMTCGTLPDTDGIWDLVRHRWHVEQMIPQSVVACTESDIDLLLFFPSL
uniref:Uncharacterized protein n=1 Tax=Arion vulgaris TaxID=1028688 RepID=A0A0B7A0V0_9EUPU